MNRPDGTPEGTQHTHFKLDNAHRWLCEHTCQRHIGSRHRVTHGRGPIAHTSDRHHANHAELQTLPDRERSLVIAREFVEELHAATDHLPHHHYAAIWAQAKAALDALLRPADQDGM